MDEKLILRISCGSIDNLCKSYLPDTYLKYRMIVFQSPMGGAYRILKSRLRICMKSGFAGTGIIARSIGTPVTHDSTIGIVRIHGCIGCVVLIRSVRRFHTKCYTVYSILFQFIVCLKCYDNFRRRLSGSFRNRYA